MQKGGILNSENIDLNQFIKGSTIKALNVNSVGGYMYIATNSSVPYTKFYPASSCPFRSMDTILIKVCQIENSTNDLHYNNKEIVKEDIFINEVHKNVDIFDKSKNLCEPICSQILDAGIAELNHDVIQQIISATNGLHFNNFKLTYPKAQFGIIIMEYLNDFKQISDYFPGYGDNNQYNDFNKFTDDQKMLCKAYFYELYRLYDIGYIHGDTHLSNAMCRVTSNYRVNSNFRVYIIDFGRTKPKTQTTNVSEIFTNIYDNKRNNVYWSYRPMITYSNTIKDNIDYYANEMNNERYPFVQQFIKRLYNEKWFKLNQFTALNKPRDIIFKITNIPIQNVDGISKIYYQNSTFNCLKIKDKEDKKWFVYPRYPIYCQDVIDIISRDKDLFKTTIDEQISNIDKGIYLWVIGYIGTTLRFATVKVINPFETGTKHIMLVQKLNFTSLYAAGELKKDDSSVIQMNLSSGTYMYSAVINKKVTFKNIIDLQEIVPIIAKYKSGDNNLTFEMNSYIEYDNNKQPKLISATNPKFTFLQQEYYQSDEKLVYTLDKINKICPLMFKIKDHMDCNINIDYNKVNENPIEYTYQLEKVQQLKQQKEREKEKEKEKEKEQKPNKNELYTTGMMDIEEDVQPPKNKMNIKDIKNSGFSKLGKIIGGENDIDSNIENYVEENMKRNLEGEIQMAKYELKAVTKDLSSEYTLLEEIKENNSDTIGFDDTLNKLQNVTDIMGMNARNIALNLIRTNKIPNQSIPITIPITCERKIDANTSQIKQNAGRFKSYYNNKTIKRIKRIKKNSKMRKNSKMKKRSKNTLKRKRYKNK